MLAAMALGAEGVQIGTLFALSAESSASEAFKQHCLTLDEGGTMLCLKNCRPHVWCGTGCSTKWPKRKPAGLIRKNCATF